MGDKAARMTPHDAKAIADYLIGCIIFMGSVAGLVLLVTGIEDWLSKGRKR